MTTIQVTINHDMRPGGKLSMHVHSPAVLASELEIATARFLAQLLQDGIRTWRDGLCKSGVGENPRFFEGEAAKAVAKDNLGHVPGETPIEGGAN